MVSHAKESAPGELVPVKFSRLTRRGVLLGLSVAQLITLGIGGLTLIAAFYAGGGMLLAYTAPIWVLSAALTWIPVGGRPVVEWLPVTFWWLWRVTVGSSSLAPPAPSPCPATWPGSANTTIRRPGPA